MSKRTEKVGGLIFTYTGSYYTKPLWKRVLLNWWGDLLTIKMFLSCLLNYKETIIGNELTLMDTWQLCESHADVRVGRTLKIDFE